MAKFDNPAALDPSATSRPYKKIRGGGGGGGSFSVTFPSDPRPLCPEFALYSHAQPSPGLALHCHQPSTTLRAACLRVHYPSLCRRFSPLSVPPLPVPPSEPIVAAEPLSSLCACNTRPLLAAASAHYQYA